MDSKGFFLGLIAAVVLFLLWKKEAVAMGLPTFLQPSPDQPARPSSSGDPGGGCSGCGGPSAAASPVAQLSASAMVGMDGQISPGTPPLQSVAGTGSFYAENGPTPDTTFTNSPASSRVGTTSQMVVRGVFSTNVPGSPTTPANQVPVRATQVVAPTSDQGFVQRWNVAGVPRTAGGRLMLL